MEGLFFAVNQVWFVYPINYGYLIVSTILVMGIAYYTLKGSIIGNLPSRDITYDYIDPNDKNYSKKTLASLKDYISKKYLPKHTWAHTHIDINLYIKNKKILKLIEFLEKIEYSGKLTTVEDHKKMNSEIALSIE